jgi:hypothetical protein
VSTDVSEARAASVIRAITALMMEAARISETSIGNYFTRQYIPEDISEFHTLFILTLSIVMFTSEHACVTVHFNDDK